MSTGKKTAQKFKKRRKWMFEWQKGACFWCHEKMDPTNPNSNRYPSFDELIPRCMGGTKARTNIVLACRICNMKRGAVIAPMHAFQYVAQREGFA